MTWATDNLRPASFRGIPFSVVSHEATMAKAVVSHELPLRDKPIVEELGRTASEFDIDAYLVGGDYQERRDALMDAVREAGAGELVHPWLGTLRVHARAVRVRESATEGRMCRLGLTFVEASASAAPETRSNAASDVQSAGQLLLDSAESEFADKLLEVDRPSSAAEGSAVSLERVADELREFDLAGPATKAAAWRAKLEDLTSDALARLAKPQDFASQLRGVFTELDVAYGSRRDLIGRLLALAHVELGRGRSVLFGGADADAGDAALSGLVASNAAAEAARLSVLFDWDTYDAALATRRDIVDVLEEIADNAGDATFAGVQGLIAQVVAGLPSPDANLPRLDSVTLPRTRPALVLAYQLYDATARETDIVTRNAVSNPAFLPVHVPLQVLVDVA